MAESYSNLIRAQRKERRWTQKELARRLHTSVATVSRWENGHTRPNLDQMGELSPALGIPLDLLIEGGGAKLTPLPEGRLDPGLVAFLVRRSLSWQAGLREFLEKSIEEGGQQQSVHP